MAAKTTTSRGYSASKEQLPGRLKRIEGQVRGVEGIVEDDRCCIDVLTQISAVQAALDKVALGLLDGHARHCPVDASEAEQPGKIEELMAAVGRMMGRGWLSARQAGALRGNQQACRVEHGHA